jgi:hypothetical protein
MANNMQGHTAYDPGIGGERLLIQKYESNKSACGVFSSSNSPNSSGSSYFSRICGVRPKRKKWEPKARELEQ